MDDLITTAMNEIKEEANPDGPGDTDALETAAFMNADYLP